MALEVFSEERFPEKVSFGMLSTARFFTTIQTAQGGDETRIANWQDARHEYTAGNEVKTQTEFDLLKAFFMTRRGPAVGFRFFDWVDFCTDMGGLKSNGLDIDILALPAAGILTPTDMRRVTDGGIGIGDGAEAQYQCIATYLAEPRVVTLVGGNPTLTFSNIGSGEGRVARGAGDWTAESWAIGDTVDITGGLNDSLTAATNARQRTYVISAISSLNLDLQADDTTYVWSAEGPTRGVRLWSNTNGGTDYFRKITKPISSAVRPYVNAVAYTEGGGATGYAIDETTGIVTFNVSPPTGETVQWEGFFDTPVRFRNDRFPGTLEEYNVLSVPIECIELRV